MAKCLFCNHDLKAHKDGTLLFRELTSAQKKASLGAMARHLNQCKRIYRETTHKKGTST